MIGDDQRDGVRRVGCVCAHTVLFEHLLRIPVVGCDQRHTALAGDRVHDPAEARVGRLDRVDDGRDRAGVADHVRVGEIDHRERVVAAADLFDEAPRDLVGGHLGLEVVGRHVAR